MILFIISSTSYSNPLKKTPNNSTLLGESTPVDTIIHISSFLDDLDIGKLTLTHKRNRSILSEKSLLGGHYLRKKSKYAITDHTDNIYFLDEYLTLPGTSPIKKIKNITSLSKENPLKFIKLALKSMPSTKEDIELHLESYFHQTIQFNQLIKELPSHNSSQERLAELIIDLAVFGKVWDHVEKKIKEQTDPYTWNRYVSQSNFQEHTQAFKRLLDQVYGSFWIQHLSNLSTKISEKNWNSEWKLLWEQVETQVSHNLHHFQFHLALDENTLSETLKSAINYTLMTYQLGLVSVRQSDEFKDVLHDPNGLLKNVKETLSETAACSILKNLEFPQVAEEHYLLKSQIEFFKRHIKNSTHR